MKKLKPFTSDSRQVKKGFTYFAISGNQSDGHQFIPDAVKKGASQIIGSMKKPSGLCVPYKKVIQPRKSLAEYATEFYGNPSSSMKVVGVTGTSGKTSTVFILTHLLRSAGYTVGSMGTVEIRVGNKKMASSHTTPGPELLQKTLKAMVEKGCDAAVLEVSSHALDQYRVWGVSFDLMVFMNLTHEHLDYHQSMSSYYGAKKKLFDTYAKFSKKKGKRPIAVINIDDPFGIRLAREIKTVRKITFGIKNKKAEVRSKLKSQNQNGTEFEILYNLIQTDLLGQHNVLNLSAAIVSALQLGINWQKIKKGILTLPSIPGRMEKVKNKKIHVYVDYAHKPDALERVLKLLKKLAHDHGKRLITVFGCGGDRDKAKRPMMGKIASKYSDQVVVTSDNPRNEKPDLIIKDIVEGIKSRNFLVEPDRLKAIKLGIQRARPGDIVLIAGKGHEAVQIFAEKTVEFDDRVQAKKLLKTIR